MEQRDWLFGLHELSGIGPDTIKKAQDKLDDIGNPQLLEIGDIEGWGIKKGRARLIKERLTESFVAARYELYEKEGIQVIVRTDSHYPKLLSEIPDPPFVIYAKGNTELLSRPSIAVVGTRKPTLYGRSATRYLVSQLCAFGFGIVSGMARGIDTEAHLTSLREQAPSIAVLGTGLDVMYPSENKQLIDKVASVGVVVSECPFGTQVRKGLFFRRNRIISGLSLGTLVVEADARSGALITADFAGDQNREVFMVPGSIFSSQSRGTLNRIKEGAICVTGGEEIAVHYENRISYFDHTNIKKKIAPGLTPDERLVLRHLSDKDATFDELLEKTQFPFGHLHTVLLSLLIKKQIQKISGSTYRRIH